MDRSQAEILLSKYNRGKATAKEIAILESWYLEEGFKSPLFKGEFNYESKRLRILSKIQQQRAPVEKVRKLWPRIAIGAAVATIIFGIGLFFYKNQQKEHAQTAFHSDVAPGRQGATLTLANGKTIRLTDATNGVLAKEAGVNITKSEDGQLVYEIKNDSGESGKINTLSTANGEMYKLRLPDGSLVWLNSASSLTYAANLIENGKRSVKLHGEGYFEIVKDKAHPFIVKTGTQEIEVLGTHFNINSYTDEPLVATTLLEGSVKITSRNEKRMLKPGEQALNNGSNIQIIQANIDKATDWKDGDFYLNHVDFKTAMRKIARWYNVEIVYDASVPDDMVAGGWISRENNLSVVLKLIEKSGLVHFKIEGRRIYVSK